ncbi:MAG: hypothetical protein EBV03_01300 [Proteobacteria bacterium]|nr:hypothetical protein [Pseudomonadota bacterium]
MRGIIRSTALLSFMLLPFAAAAESSITRDNSTMSLVAEPSVITRGQQSFRAAVLIAPKKGWHIYWENPGDSGLAPTLEWQLPQGFTAGSIDWPPPSQLNEGELATYSYEEPTLLPVTIITPAELKADTATLKVKADILVCKDICVPESAELDITLPVSDRTAKPSASVHLFEQHDKIRPQPVEKMGHYSADADNITLGMPLAALGLGEEDRIHIAHFYAREQNVVKYAAAQQYGTENGELTITIPRAEGGQAPEALSGILTVMTRGNDARAYNISLASGSGTAAGTAGAPQENMLFPVALLLALLGGLVLNLMPCVLPVLSLKAIALAKKAGRDHAHVCAQGISYTLGIMLSFAVISGVLLVLRAGGDAVGWGYQMQSPTFVATLVYLLFLVGLSLSGMFHLPVLLGGVGTKITSETSDGNLQAAHGIPHVCFRHLAAMGAYVAKWRARPRHGAYFAAGHGIHHLGAPHVPA